MSDIVISGGGQTRVATDELLTSARNLATLVSRIDGWLASVRHASAMDITALSFGVQPDFGTGELLIASDDLSRAQHLAHRLGGDLNEAAENYGRAERAATGAGELAGAIGGYELGSLWPILLVWFGIPLAVGAGGEAAASVFFPDLALFGRRALGNLLSSHRGILSTPAFVALVRMAVSSADDGMLGAAHIPLPLALGVGERVFGLTGAAREVVGAGQVAGALRETPVVVHQASASKATPPTGYADLAARVPASRPGMPQVRIEKYAASGEPASGGQASGGRPKWIVYVGGTVDTGFTAGGEPFDDTSNLQGIAKLDPASVRATEQAMKAAGIEPGDSVLSVGYSQGGIVATDIVTDGGYENAGLVTFGSPTGGIDVPSDVPDVAVEVTEDVVPALGGYPRSAGDGGLDRILVQHSAYDGRAVPADELAASALPAHNIRNYRDTATLMDASSDPRLTGVRDTITSLTGGAPSQTTMWRADRVQSAG